MTTIEDLTYATTIRSYETAADLGSIDLSNEQAAAVFASAQWPQGILLLADLRNICGDDTLADEVDGETTVYID